MDKKLLIKVGFRAINLINEQIEQGIDKDGNPYKYSTNPFAMPAGAALKKIFTKSNQKAGRIKFIKRNSSTWIVLPKGYADYRLMTGRSATGDFLQFTGRMLKSMTPLIEGDNRIVIKFSDANKAKIAYYLNVSGAGKNRKMWKFFGLTKENQNKLISEFASEIVEEKFKELGK